MIRSPAALASTLVAVIALGACQSSRFGSPGPVASARPGAGYNAPEPMLEDIPAAPFGGPVTSEPLAPLPGTSGGAVAEVPTIPPPQINQPQQAAIVTPGRSSAVGAWTAREATGSTCRVQLSSSPALDLYKASATGCANKDLARVSAWDYRDGEVYLYQQGGTVAARLRSSGASLDGALSKSGAPLTLAR